MANFLDLFSSGPGETAAAKAAAAKRKGIKKGAAKGEESLKKYEKQAVSTVGEGLPNWQQIFNEGAPGIQTYYGAAGVPGYDAAAARSAWESSIPYSMFQGLVPGIQEAALRRGGMSGQTGQIPIDMNNRLLQALNQFYEPWLGQLAHGFNQEELGARGQQDVFNKEAELKSGLGTNLANLFNTKFTNLGQTESDRVAQVFGAGQGAASNQLQTGLALANIAASLFGGGANTTGASTGLSKLFSGTGGTGTGSGFDPIQGGYDPNWTTQTSLG